ncbi:OsmC family protein [Dickeya dadantii]|uniref:OsmC family protein n=1 Tax=Dickeya dadantii TaxID=204038 RepID=UPI0013723157|nr:OsmC family protein [Dickeya dadantii]NAT79368.1 peroxiredoxin [Dickeya dadantii]NPE58748.1 OsmC family protein [Dickeya dadantii]NPE62503.1 OsmC family protein [Dickeya dadantii]NPE72825.1 OsmC family protein [Dickeya dadantii]
MADKIHRYQVQVSWTGNQGAGTASYRGYSRNHDISAPGKPTLPGSSDPSFRGDPARWNPEELLVASLSACHKLWYLGLCAGAGVTVVAYDDQAEGEMVEEAGGAGQFLSVTLRPRVVISADSDPQTALALHHQAHEMCFIARSVNFTVTHQPDIVVDNPSSSHR